MHPADIKAALQKARSSASALGRQLGVSQVSVSRVLNGDGRSARIEQAISTLTDLPRHQLWPQWYAEQTGWVDPISLDAQFRTRLRAEMRRLDIEEATVMAICDPDDSMRSIGFFEAGYELPSIELLLKLGASTRIDIAYLVAGGREH